VLPDNGNDISFLRFIELYPIVFLQEFVLGEGDFGALLAIVN